MSRYKAAVLSARSDSEFAAWSDDGGGWPFSPSEVFFVRGLREVPVAARRGSTGQFRLPQTHSADVDAKIEVTTHNVADLDRRLGQIDTAIGEATRRGKTKSALSAMEGQRKGRAGLVSETARPLLWQPSR